MGGGLWVDQCASCFPRIGAISEPGVYPEKGDPSTPIQASELLSGSSKRCTARFYASRCPRESKLWDVALLQVEKGWLEGPFEVSADSVIRQNGEDFQGNPAFRFGVLRGKKLRAADDLKQSFTDGATRGLTPINLPT